MYNKLSFLIFKEINDDQLYVDVFAGTYSNTEEHQPIIRQNLKLYDNTIKFICAVGENEFKAKYEDECTYLHAEILGCDGEPSEIFVYSSDNKSNLSSVVFKIENSYIHHLYPFMFNECEVLIERMHHSLNHTWKNSGKINSEEFGAFQRHLTQYGTNSWLNNDGIKVHTDTSFNLAYRETILHLKNTHDLLNSDDDEAVKVLPPSVKPDFVSPRDRIGNNGIEPVYVLYIDEYIQSTSGPEYMSTKEYIIPSELYIKQTKYLHKAIELIIDQLNFMDIGSYYYFRGILHEPASINDSNMKDKILPLLVSAHVLNVMSDMLVNELPDNPYTFRNSNTGPLTKFF